MVKIIREAQYEKLMKQVVEPGLAAMREEIDMPLSAGGALHCEVYNRYDARRAVVIVHGYTECAEKFRELTWYFVQSGFSVFAMDQRGHGKSVREVEDLSVTHVEHFSDYLRDLEEFMEKIVHPRTSGQKLCLFGHSMGGAVAAFALIEHPEWFSRAVLNAPMIAPITKPLPRLAAKAMGDMYCLLGKGRERAFVGKPFDPAREKFDTSHMTSRARFDYYQAKRVAREELHNCSPTYGWIREAAGVTEPLLHRAQMIRVPVMLLQAMQDSIVGLAEQERFIKKVPDGKLVRFDAKHELYSSHDEVLGDYVNKIIDFMSEE
ncbi:MAG: alpha/beta fold hydrolase [Clostridia bacterium]|nr:alpha/beta fold hydrolase [Clostridia bacterium]